MHLAGAVAAQEPAQQTRLLQLWLDQTRAAAKYRRRFARPHPQWGDGSLTARALKACPAPPALGAPGPGALSALALVAAALAEIGQSRRKGIF